MGDTEGNEMRLVLLIDRNAHRTGTIMLENNFRGNLGGNWIAGLLEDEDVYL